MALKRPVMKYVVIVRRHNYGTDAYGPYRTFHQAEGDAKAWDGINGQFTYVVPLQSPAEGISKETGNNVG
jgi:hypothetical protein